VEIAVYQWPGESGLTLALSHGTGFCAGVWRPFIEEVRNCGFSGSIVAWDHRAHGGSSEPPLPIDWWDVARDAGSVLTSLTEPLIGVGHSLGAASLLMAEILSPGRFEAIVAVEPIVFPPPFQPADHHPLAQLARRRRPSFAGKQEALENFSQKPVFAAWDRRALEGYVDCGLLPDGEEWSLACPPEFEASFFASGGAHDAWDRLPEVRLPVQVVAGRDSDTHPAEFAREQTARMARATLEIVDDSGHFLPMEQPGRVAAIAAQTIESIASS